MKLPSPLAIQYALRLLVGTAIIWYGMKWLGAADPKWAVISLIVVTDPALNKARDNFVARSVNTLTGCLVACGALLAFGATLSAMMIAITVSVLIATTIERYPANWRLAPATAVLLIVAGFDHSSMAQDLHLVMLRAGEVLAGGGVAILLGLCHERLRQRLNR
jgi:uncharacterized membrane protein YccC